MKTYEDILEVVERKIEVDWIPLNVIVNTFIESGQKKPNREEFEETLEFITKMLNREAIVCLKGPEMTKVDGDGHEIADWISELYDEEGYENINYNVWFDQKRHYV